MRDIFAYRGAEVYPWFLWFVPPYFLNQDPVARLELKGLSLVSMICSSLFSESRSGRKTGSYRFIPGFYDLFLLIFWIKIRSQDWKLKVYPWFLWFVPPYFLNQDPVASVEENLTILSCCSGFRKLKIERISNCCSEGSRLSEKHQRMNIFETWSCCVQRVAGWETIDAVTYKGYRSLVGSRYPLWLMQPAGLFEIVQRVARWETIESAT